MGDAAMTPQRLRDLAANLRDDVVACKGFVADELDEAAAEIERLQDALAPFARKAKAFDWRKGSVYKTLEGEEFSDDQAKVLLDTIEVAKAATHHLSIGDFRRAHEVVLRAMKAD
jgi:hypothetical protein